MKLVRGLSRRQRLAACLGLVVLLVACFDPPVRERLDLVFLPQGPVAALYRVEISDHGSDNQNLARRVAELERSLLEGTDAWSRSFARLEPAAERLEWRKRGGELSRFERGAILEDPAALLELFAECPITVGYSAREDGGELAFYTGAGSRASRSERRQVERRTAAWVERLAAYLTAIDEIVRTLRPERARRCLAEVFDLPHAEEDPLSAEEQQLVDALDERLGEVAEVLLVSTGEAHSLDELSRLVYDPFPAELSVRVPGEIVEVEGFQAVAAGQLEVPGLGLWKALAGLVERWPTLQPLLDLEAAADAPKDQPPTIDLERLLAAAAAGPPPDATTLGEALTERLEAAPIYRVAWRVPPTLREKDTPFDWGTTSH